MHPPQTQSPTIRKQENIRTTRIRKTNNTKIPVQNTYYTEAPWPVRCHPSRRQYMKRYVRGTRGNNSPAAITFEWTILVCTGFGKSILVRDFTARERKTTGNRHFHGNRLDGNGQSGFHGNHLGGKGNQHFFGNCLRGTTGTTFARERE